jgi:guanylate kinase
MMTGPQHNGRLLMVAAPSGAGKSSLVRAFLERHNNWALSISTTTRPPRPGEVHGREYFFATKAEFVTQRDRGEFLEWAEVHGNFYGTSKAWIEDQIRQSRNILLEIDWQGAQQIRSLFQGMPLAARSVFILPPSLEELAVRLRNRGQDSEEVISRRLAAAEEEMSHAKEFDYVIINQDFSSALAEFEAIAESVLKPS